MSGDTVLLCLLRKDFYRELRELAELLPTHEARDKSLSLWLSGKTSTVLAEPER